MPTAESLKLYREKVGKDYYAVDHKGFTFVIVNTQLWKAPMKGESEKHDTWFATTLKHAKARKSPVVVVGHYPLFLKSLTRRKSISIFRSLNGRRSYSFVKKTAWLPFSVATLTSLSLMITKGSNL